ncbi:MAG: sodium:calcium antiporter [Candidatus Bathyarchaeota archaeon]|nr:sodium:calcium antiporter [Candidatus Bathyarchaeota archaeon]
MWDLVYSLLGILGGITLLYVSSGRIVEYVSKLAYNLNLSKIYLGAIIVAFITALPELITSVVAATYGNSPHMALGNVVGSNIYNIPVVIGICWLAKKRLNLDRHALRKEALVMLILSTTLMLLLFVTRRLTSWISSMFLLAYPIYLYRSIKLTNQSGFLTNGGCKYGYKAIRNLAAIITYGLTLVTGAYILVYSATIMADTLRLSHLYAGMNILSLGCIIPEIAVSISAAFRDEHDIALGNVIGDNIITITLVLGIIGLTTQPEVTVTDIIFTIPFMNLATILALIASRYGRNIERIHGLAVMALVIVLYILETILIA